MRNYAFWGTNGDESVRLLPDGYSGGPNVFTVVVGKNGVGKSRLLSNLAREHREDDRGGAVIAISTSPFDKFPLVSRNSPSQTLDHYTYVGMRDGVYTHSSSVSLISAAARGLIRKLAEQDELVDLSHVFSSMGLEPYVRFTFKLNRIDPGLSRRIAPIDDPRLSPLQEALAVPLRPEQAKRLQRLSDVQLAGLRTLVGQLRMQDKAATKAAFLGVHFANGPAEIGTHSFNSRTLRALAAAMEAGLVRLMDIELHKQAFGPLSLKRASSGEQCLLVLLLGIAGNIENGALVLIDEPEISLHPKWQEDFMQMLMRAFSGYRGCQFIIATHSPQITSRLQGDHCFIASLSKQQLYAAGDFSSRSADFQLAELFEAPGLMNEYISRLAFSLLARLKARQAVGEEESGDLARLRQLSRNLDHNDPTFELVRSVTQAFAHYAVDR